MNVVIALFIGCAVGFMLGFMVFRNNAAKIQKAEHNIMDIAGKFKRDGE